jgi:hypothetical protein
MGQADTAERFVADATATFGDNVASIFSYGAACFPPSPVTDFDAHVLLHRPMTDEDRTTLRELWRRFEGEDHDVWWITLEDSKRPVPPVHQGNTSMSDTAWALHRAHVHAGRYVTLFGFDPREIVPVPTWEELDDGLQSALADALRSSYGEYSVLNLCRILCSYANHDVVFSKLQGAMFALAALPDEWHEIVRAALDGYRRGDFKKIDPTAFRREMTARIETARVG